MINRKQQKRPSLKANAINQLVQESDGQEQGLYVLLAAAGKAPRVYTNIEERWLTERLKAMGLDQPGMGWHAFRRFRETRLGGERCQPDINVFWMGHQPETMSELYSQLFEEVEKWLAEAEREAVAVAFDIPAHSGPQ
jgi:hypothetical protein